MEFRQLSYFLAAAQTENFRRAAELCLVTQPALSRQIAALEKELDILLFRRIKQRVELTPAGATFVEYAKDALDLLQEGEQELMKWRHGLSGTLVVGSNQSLIATFLPPMLAKFRRDFPEIRVRVRIESSDQVITLIEQGEVDLGFIYDPAMHSDLVVMKEIFRQPLRLLTYPDSPLASLLPSECTLARIVKEPLILLNKEARLRKVLDRMFVQRGLNPRPVIEIESIEGLRDLVFHECGVSLIPPALLRPPGKSEELLLLPIADVSETFLFALAYSRIHSITPPARQFIRLILQSIQEP